MSKRQDETLEHMVKRINATLYKDIRICISNGQEVTLDSNIHKNFDYYEKEIYNILKFRYFKNLTFNEQLLFVFNKRKEAIEREDI